MWASFLVLTYPLTRVWFLINCKIKTKARVKCLGFDFFGQPTWHLFMSMSWSEVWNISIDYPISIVCSNLGAPQVAWFEDLSVRYIHDLARWPLVLYVKPQCRPNGLASIHSLPTKHYSSSYDVPFNLHVVEVRTQACPILIAAPIASTRVFLFFIIIFFKRKIRINWEKKKEEERE